MFHVPNEVKHRGAGGDSLYEIKEKTHMVKFHEDAYWLNNLSLFAFNIEGHWSQINKIMRENRPPVLSSISLEYL